MSRSPSSSSSSSSSPFASSWLAAVLLVMATGAGCKKSGTEAGAGSAVVTGSATGSASGNAGSAATGSAMAAPGSASGSDTPDKAAVGSGAGSGSNAATAIDPGPQPASVTPEILATLDKAMGAVDAFMTELGAAGTDCVKATEAAKKHMGPLAAIDEETKKVSSIDQAGQLWLSRRMADKVSASIKKGEPTMEACKTDPRFIEVMGQLKL